MKRSRFSKEQIIGILKEHQAGMSASDQRLEQSRHSHFPGKVQLQPTQRQTVQLWLMFSNIILPFLIGQVGGMSEVKGCGPSDRRHSFPTTNLIKKVLQEAGAAQIKRRKRWLVWIAVFMRRISNQILI